MHVITSMQNATNEHVNYTGYFLKLNLTHFTGTYVQLLQYHSNAIVNFIHLIIIHVTIKNTFFSFMTEIKDPHILYQV